MEHPLVVRNSPMIGDVTMDVTVIIAVGVVIFTFYAIVSAN
jgi:hypothetical protein